MIMSWEFFCALGLTGGWAVCLGWIALWGATVNVSEFNRESPPVTKVRPWVLQQFNDMHSMYGVPVVSEDT